jgi:hypothetical protein
MKPATMASKAHRPVRHFRPAVGDRANDHEQRKGRQSGRDPGESHERDREDEADDGRDEPSDQRCLDAPELGACDEPRQVGLEDPLLVHRDDEQACRVPTDRGEGDAAEREDAGIPHEDVEADNQGQVDQPDHDHPSGHGVAGGPGDLGGGDDEHEQCR